MHNCPTNVCRLPCIKRTVRLTMDLYLHQFLHTSDRFGRAMILPASHTSTAVSIQRLPPELLLLIFSALVDDERTQNLHPSRRMVITHICRHWRLLAENSRNLWTYIKMSCSRKLVQLFVQRANVAALDIHIPEQSGFYENTRMRYNVRRIILQRPKPAIRSLKLDGYDHDDIRMFCAPDLLDNNTRALEELVIDTRSYVSPILAHLLKHDAPKLRNLKLEYGILTSEVAIRFPNLTSLYLHEFEHDASVFLDALEQLPLLESMDILMGSEEANDLVPESRPSVRLDHLRSLVFGHNVLGIRSILAHLIIPHSALICIDCDVGYDDEMRTVLGDWETKSLPSCISKISHVTLAFDQQPEETSERYSLPRDQSCSLELHVYEPDDGQRSMTFALNKFIETWPLVNISHLIIASDKDWRSAPQLWLIEWSLQTWGDLLRKLHLLRHLTVDTPCTTLYWGLFRALECGTSSEPGPSCPLLQELRMESLAFNCAPFEQLCNCPCHEVEPQCDHRPYGAQEFCPCRARVFSKTWRSDLKRCLRARRDAGVSVPNLIISCSNKCAIRCDGLDDQHLASIAEDVRALTYAGRAFVPTQRPITGKLAPHTHFHARIDDVQACYLCAGYFPQYQKL